MCNNVFVKKSGLLRGNVEKYRTAMKALMLHYTRTCTDCIVRISDLLKCYSALHGLNLITYAHTQDIKTQVRLNLCRALISPIGSQTYVVVLQSIGMSSTDGTSFPKTLDQKPSRKLSSDLHSASIYQAFLEPADILRVK